MNNDNYRKAVSRALIIVLCLISTGCSYALFGAKSVGQMEPFVRHIHEDQTLQAPAWLFYAEQSPVIGFFFCQYYKRGEMYDLETSPDRGREKAFDLPAGTPVTIEKVVYHTNMAGSSIIAFGKAYIDGAKKEIPFFYIYRKEDEGGEVVLYRAPWEPASVPEKRYLRMGPLANQYLGLKSDAAGTDPENGKGRE